MLSAAFDAAATLRFSRFFDYCFTYFPCFYAIDAARFFAYAFIFRHFRHYFALIFITPLLMHASPRIRCQFSLHYFLSIPPFFAIDAALITPLFAMLR